jgi:hypothetical protein
MLETAPGSLLVFREKRGRRHLHRNIYPIRRLAFGGYIATGSQCGDNTGRLPLIQGINETEMVRILGLPLLDRIIFPSLE